jgi:hypothetical protein
MNLDSDMQDASSKTPPQGKKVKPTKTTSRRSALLSSTAVAFGAVLQYFNVFGHEPRDHKLRINNNASGAVFTAYTATTMACAMADTFAYNTAFLPPEPRSQREARQRPDSDKWKKAENKEVGTLWDMKTFQVVDRPKNGYDPLPLRFVYKLKIED